ncbi:TetR/AcrR family transcriptional regulator [Nocardiopsis coralliicola]
MADGTADAIGAAERRGASGVPARIMAAATRLFAERGFERTSVQELVVAAGVTKGAMYHYFASKDDLLYAVTMRLLGRQRAAIETIADGPEPVADRLHRAAVAVVADTAAHFDDAVITVRTAPLLSADRQRSVRVERRAVHDRFVALVAEGQRAGVFRAEVPAHLALTQFFGAVQHMATWYRPDGGLGGAEIGGHFAGLLLAGLGVPPQAVAGGGAPAGSATGTGGPGGSGPGSPPSA